MKRAPQRVWRKRLLLVLLSSLFALFVTEIFLRLTGYSYPLLYQTDYDRGVALRPGVSGLYQREGRNYVTINSDGLRDLEHTRTKPANTIRIALLGDSFCEALQVPLEQTFWRLLQQKLEACNAFPGKHVEIINFGVSGYGTGQELITLEKHARDYHPDIVMLLVTTSNDITDNRRELKQTNDIPFFVYRNGELVVDNSFRESKGYRWNASATNRFVEWFRDHLRTVQLLYYVHMAAKLKLSDWRSQKQTPAPAPASAPATAAATQPPVDVVNMIYLEPADENWREAWRVTEALIKRMRDEVREDGAKFMMVVDTTTVQAAPDPAVRQRFIDYLGVRDLLYPNRRLKALAENEQIDLLDLVEPMQAYAEKNRVYLHGFGKDLGNGHWNADGHRLAAELIAQKMCQQQ